MSDPIQLNVRAAKDDLNESEHGVSVKLEDVLSNSGDGETNVKSCEQSS